MKRKILFAEDDAATFEVIAEFMRFEDCEVIADNGKSIGRNLQRHSVGLILLDEKLGYGRGSSICRILKSDARTSWIPIFLISALSEIDKIAEECGADGYIRKPFDINNVIKVVNAQYIDPNNFSK